MRKNKQFEYYINSWLIQKNFSVKESTMSRYSEIVNIYIKPTFGNLHINKINNQLVLKYLNYLINNDNLKSKTKKDIVTLLKQIFKFSNINIDIKLPKCNKKKIKILTKSEQHRLEEYVKNNLNFTNIGILLSLYMGLRIGELCSLKWENIDLNNKTITISSTLLRIKNLNDDISKTKIVIDTPKTNNSLRVIPIPSSIFKLLLQLHKNVNNKENYVLTNTVKFIEPRAYYYSYKKIMKLLKLEEYNFHSLRHTFATRCVELGFDYKTLSEILGHSDIKMTLSFYVHPTNELKIKSMEKLKMF